MSRILDRERDTYQTIWGVEAYRAFSPGEQYVPFFLDMSARVLPNPAVPLKGSVLDAGCGSGKGALALQTAGFDVTLCDLTDEGLTPEIKASGLRFVEACLWHDVVPRVGFKDWVFACDVLEHIPTPFTMLVIANLLKVARRGLFLSIALQPDTFGAWVGKPLHQTVQSFVDWRDQISELGTVVECRDLLDVGLYLVTPKEHRRG